MPDISFDIDRFNRLESRVDSLLNDGVIDRKDKSLIYLFLTHRFYREQFEIDESFTDGGNDCGIDAIFIDRNKDQPIVHMFQSKYHMSVRKSQNPFKSSAAQKVVQFLEVIRNRNKDLSKVANPLLIQKILEIRDLQDRDFPEFKLWLVSNGSPCIDHEIDPISNILSNEKVDIEQFHLNEFIEFCIDAHSIRTNYTFYTREVGFLEFGKSGLRSFVGYISAKQLYELLKDIRDERKIDYSLFNMNVRGFLGLDNKVNMEIFRTAVSKDNIYFSALNNGITIVGTQCKELKTATDAPKIGIKRMSIVNGAQTCSAIFNAMKDYYPDLDHFDNLSVLFRAFETDDPEVIGRISTSTNNQNKINSRDLRANDEHQLRIERELSKHSILYLRKRGQIQTDLVDGRKLDALRAGQLILSYIKHDPARAKRDSDSIFSDLYNDIFSDASINDIVKALEWYDLIESQKQYIEDEIRIRGVRRTENTFVTYGVFHILMLCSLINKDANPEDRPSVIQRSIKIIAEIIKDYGEPAYYSFFETQKSQKCLKNR